MWDHIVNDEFCGWGRIEDDYIGSYIPDGYVFTKACESAGPLFTVGTVLVAAAPADDETYGAWWVCHERIDLNEVPLDEMADYIKGCGYDSIASFAEEAFGYASHANTVHRQLSWQQSLGEGLLNWRIGESFSNKEWMLCRSAESARKAMNALMQARLPEGYLENSFAIGSSVDEVRGQAHTRLTR